MSALREIKFLRELSHPNVITVSKVRYTPLGTRYNGIRHSKLLDVFAQGATLNLVLEFLDTDLEALIKDMGTPFRCADVKSWMAMSFRGLEFCHRNGILHRVSHLLVHASRIASPLTRRFNNTGSETEQLTDFK